MTEMATALAAAAPPGPANEPSWPGEAASAMANRGLNLFYGVLAGEVDVLGEQLLFALPVFRAFRDQLALGIDALGNSVDGQ